MATLIAVYTSDGCVGRCDAKCYTAKDPHCDCICGGKNHGAGLQQATCNTRQWAEAWLERYHAERGLDPAKTRSVLGEAASQFDLPL